MSNDLPTDREELQLKAMLRAVEADAAPVDRSVLDALRDRTSDAFAAAFDQSAQLPHSSTTGVQATEDRASENVLKESVGPSQLPTPQTHQMTPVARPSRAAPSDNRRNPMFTLAMRGALAAAVTVIGMATWFVSTGPKPVSAAAVPFSKIIDELRGASTLEFQLVKQGVASQILVREPGLVRKQQTEQRYEIAAGSRLWRIDEQNNSVTESDSPWFSEPNAPIDLLGLLELGIKDSSPLLRARPVERTVFPPEFSAADGKPDASTIDSVQTETHGRHDRKNCLVYRVELPTQRGRVQVEAFVNGQNQQLLGIFAWPAGEKRHVAPPLAEMRLVAMNAAVADEKFEISKSLTEDGRVGKVTQSQGIVVLRPMTAQRWTPIGCDTILKPGDWVRTELRGANAVKLRMSSDVELTLGPGTRVELISPTKARVHNGMIQVHWEADTTAQGDKEPAKATTHDFTLLAPREGSRVFRAGNTQLLRIDRNEQLVDVAQKPVWLAGFEGTSNNESIGSLIVNLPDGRNEPLTVGFHKVSVEIRDQIARTTIEESFVNHTPSRLEGVFHFPLPQDASISGFGMWIGNDLVEADVVEKQRAREIYETILRERRDPGLLEWTSGNIFKARVFPIEAHSEKRIKIVYTQVLPLQGNRYRYAYGLRSEMLRTKPLRELSLTVTVNSSLGLKSITCPTHTVRTQQTAHSGRVEFAAQEYTPTRDFEVVCEIDGQQSDVVLIPHRRGDDGYFLVQITPPFQREATAGGARLTELIPDGKPLHVTLLCDTSASMNVEKRSQQSQFVATVLSSMGKDDRFQIAACDVGTVWNSPTALAPTSDNVASALAFLDNRQSLGWTNLDRAFDDVLKRVPAGSHVVYVGDGLISSGDTDPAAFVKRLGQLVATSSPAKPDSSGKEVPGPSGVTLSAVTVGNTSEGIVLRGIASVGGGSVRAVGGEQTPQVVSRDFLNEIAQPGLRDVNVEFRGLKVAAVYPGRLPNLPAGTQQILVGRYLPELAAPANSDQQGEVVVTGLRGAERVKFAARVSLKNAEEGNSFIPRLWARAHLDHLLAQGQSGLIHDEIIQLSEEFHIITPYTSLLVLETDADRERFGVKRRYEMRDGERFFAEGRNNSNYELLQQQMKRAGDWRIGMRRNVLQALARLGRNPQVFQQVGQRDGEIFNFFAGMDRGSLGNRPMSSSVAGPAGGAFGGRGGYGGGGFGYDAYFDSSPLDGLKDNLSLEFGGRLNESDKKQDSSELGMPSDSREGLFDVTKSLGDLAVSNDEVDFLSEVTRFKGEKSRKAEVASRRQVRDADWDVISDFEAIPMAGEPDMTVGLKLSLVGKPVSGSLFGRGVAMGRYEHFRQPDYTSWINSLFPALPARPAKNPPEVKDPEGWSAEALALSHSLLRIESLSKLDGGLEVRQEVRQFDPRWNRVSSRSVNLALYSPTAWLARSLNHHEQTLVNYCDEKERGIYSLSFLLGRSRASAASELKVPPLSLADFSLTKLSQSYAGFSAKVETMGDNQVHLILTTKNSGLEIRFLINTARHVILRRTTMTDGKLNDLMKFENFIEAAGSWWATKVVTFNDQEQPTSESELEITLLPKDQYSAKLSAEMSAKPTVQFMRLPFVSLATARQKCADGSASFDDRLMMVIYNANLQQWDELWKHVDAAEKAAAGQPGIRWIRTMLLETIRRNEEAQQRFIAEATGLTRGPIQDEVFLSEFVLSHLRSLSSLPDFYKAHQSLKPVYFRPHTERVPAVANFKAVPEQDESRAIAESQRQVQQIWTDREIASLEGLGRIADSLALQQKAAAEMPWDYSRQETYAQKLAAAGQWAAAHAWLRTALTRPEINTSEDDALRSAVADLYRQQSQWAELLKWTTEWIARNSDSSSYQSPYSQHLAAMIYNDQLDAAYTLADQWLRDAMVKGKIAGPVRARLESALNFANGSLYYLHFRRMDQRWFAPLAEMARYFVRDAQNFDIVGRCVSNHYFSQSDLSDRLRGEWLTMLQTDLAKLDAAQIGTLVSWTLRGRLELPEPMNGRKQLDASEIPVEVWRKIEDQLKARWSASSDKDEKHSFGETIRSIYADRFADTLLLPFLRERVATAPAQYKLTYVSNLFETLLTTKWTDEIEQEAFARLRELSEAKDAAERLMVLVPALLRLDDAMLANRIAAAERVLNDQGQLDKLTRKELAEKKAAFRTSARKGLAVRLSQEVAKAEPVIELGLPVVPVRRQDHFSLADWFKIEEMWLEVLLDQNLDQVAAASWNLLGDAPPKTKPHDDQAEANDNDPGDGIEREQLLQHFLDAVLRQRAFVTVMNLAVRKHAPAGTVERLTKYIDAGISDEAASSDKDPKTQPEAPAAMRRSQSFWRMAKFRLLIALDKADDLERELREWIRADVSTGPWRQALARLLAERGKLDEAIALFEACMKDKLLSSDDYKQLSDWYLVQNRRDDYQRSRIESYLQMPEQNLAQMLYQIQNRWQQHNVTLPSELDENSLFVFKALLQKSANPENYFWQIRNVYAASRDFRLLQMLPDAVLGRTPTQVYAFFNNLNGQVLYELRNEATADEIISRVKALRTPDRTVMDQRALDLMEAVVERKSAEVLNQRGPHVEACLSALQRAFQREWGEGEPVLMSRFLANLGGLPSEKLLDEQLRELRGLQQLVPEGSRDHLSITHDLCRVIFDYTARRDAGLRQMEAEATAYLQQTKGVWPHADNAILSSYVQMYEAVGRHAAGESMLFKLLDHPEHDEQRTWLRDRLMGLYNNALEHDGAVTLGTGRANLLKPIVDRSLKELSEALNEQSRYMLVVRLNTTFEIANRHRVPGLFEIVKSFAFETMPALLKKQQQQYRSTATTMVHMINMTLGSALCLQYVVERMEQWPQRLEIQYDNSWSALGGELAAHRRSTGASDLDPRVLKLAITQLKRQLRDGEGGGQAIFYIGYQDFWREKTEDFARAAEEVLNERRTSGRLALSVAEYLRSGLLLGPRAIEILQIAHGKGLLDESTQFQLVSWLHQFNRFAEMIPLLEPLVVAHPDNITYRTELMVAYFHSQRMEQLRDLTIQTDEHMHQAGRWTEPTVAQFARGCQGSQQWQRSRDYWIEAIALHQRGNPSSGLNDQTLSQYYQELALAESRLNQTAAAVTAASAALVCWDARNDNRQYAINTLRTVLSNARDLDEYVASLDAEAQKTGQDSPILRKAVGETYKQRNQHVKAITQLQLAADLQPHDQDIQKSLISCYDATNQPAEATKQLLKLIDLQPHNLELYQQLADRLKDNEAEAERASTSIVESSPNEAEPQAALAELRQRQNRWDEAIPHWEQVAKLRKLEPNGLLKLAAAQLHEKKWDSARETLNKLSKTEWPSRFANVEHEIRAMQNQLPK